MRSGLIDYLKNENLKKIMPSVSNILEAKKIYLKYYNKNKLDRYEFMAIHINLLTNWFNLLEWNTKSYQQ